MKENVKSAAIYVGTLVHWVVLGITIGCIGGIIGTAFYYVLDFVTSARILHSWLIWFLPAGGLLIVFMYRACGETKNTGTNLIILAIRNSQPIPVRIAPLIFTATAITHLFGGSAGREGAALQIGGSIGYFLGKLFGLSEKEKRILTMSGMAALFSALFGTPIAAAVFVLEMTDIGMVYYTALLPCTVAALSASELAIRLGAEAERFQIPFIPDLDFGIMCRILILAAVCALVASLFCYAMKFAHDGYIKYIKNPYVCVALGGFLILLLTLALGTRDYLGAGTEVIARAISGTARPEAFALKIIFTALTLGAGFKGGEIVPSFFIGATFGCTVSSVLGIPAGFGAAVGLLSVFCGVTNCPIGAFLIACELFGFEGAPFFLFAAAVSFLVSGYTSLYKEQRFLYSKIKLERFAPEE